MRNLPPPPIPQKLREMLKDYPECLQELRKVLNDIVSDPSYGTPPFEMAVWILGDTLSDFAINAHDELQTAEASRDLKAVTKAKEKELLMYRARSGSAGGGMLDLNELKAYFDAKKEALG